MSHHRTRAWRRAQRARRGRRGKKQKQFSDLSGDKSWKFMYMRSCKLHRARQLGHVWPYREWAKLFEDTASVNVLFVCSRNQWRSPTGEELWRKTPGVEVRSAGTSRNAQRRLSLVDIRWADLILVMEQKHKSRIRADFRDEVKFKALQVLDIPDDYGFMDLELVEIIREKTASLITLGNDKG